MDSRLQSLQAWLIERNPGLETVDLDLDLLESQLVDSMGFVELIHNIQALSGVEVDMGAVDVDTFRSLRSIAATYFSAGAPTPNAAELEA